MVQSLAVAMAVLTAAMKVAVMVSRLVVERVESSVDPTDTDLVVLWAV
jgi:hypothetical protein